MSTSNKLAQRKRVYWANADKAGNIRSAPLKEFPAGPWLFERRIDSAAWRFPGESPVRVRVTVIEDEDEETTE